GIMGFVVAAVPFGTCSRIHAICDVELHHSLLVDAGLRRPRREYGRLQLPRPQRPESFRFWGQRCDSGLSRRTMVDVFNRGVAPCRSFTHSLQYDVDPAARAGRVGNVRPEPMVIIYTIAGVTGFAASTLSGAFIP